MQILINFKFTCDFTFSLMKSLTKFIFFSKTSYQKQLHDQSLYNYSTTDIER